MNINISSSGLSGAVNVISSKSQAHRFLICAALSSAPSQIECNALSKDISATISCLNALGAEITVAAGGFHVKPIGALEPRSGVSYADCGESGSTLRFLLPLAAALGKEITFTGCGRLSERPLSPLYEQLEEHGCILSGNGKLPLSVSGILKSGRFKLPGNISSQFISGLLFALPLLPEDSVIEIVGKLESASYINMTLDALKSFGIKIAPTSEGYSVKGNQKYILPRSLKVEGDWSNSAFWLVAGAINQNSDITCRGLDEKSLQGDKAILTFLERFGAKIERKNGEIKILPAPLHGINIDVSDVPDLAPILAVAAAAAQGTTRISKAQRLRLKESDRIKSTKLLLLALGADISETEDGLTISGGKKLSGNISVSSFNDHRIAMSAAIAATICEGSITIEGAEAVEKSYPDFFKIFNSLNKER